MERVAGGVTAPRGFRAGGVHCGLKRKDLDMALIVSEVPASCFIGYTSNRMRAAPVQLMMDASPRQLSAFIVNSGNANALTGERGYRDAERMRTLAAGRLGVDPSLVGVSSTGVIGRYLDMGKVENGIAKVSDSLGVGEEYDRNATQAIITTDTVTKQVACKVSLEDGTTVTIGGMAKGSGMIAPQMRSWHATTLSFLTTDAALSPSFADTWQEVLDGSFNMISVDGDQSTNDMSALLANGVSGARADEDPAFLDALSWAARELAKMVARDGEGATKLLEVTVGGAVDESGARSAVRAVTSSSLVKAAVFGADPNYGRVMMALGNSDCPFEIDKVAMWLSGGGSEVRILEAGAPLITTAEQEAEVRRVMESKEVGIRLDLGMGEASATGWGCDLTYEYVRINAEYTT